MRAVVQLQLALNQVYLQTFACMLGIASSATHILCCCTGSLHLKSDARRYAQHTHSTAAQTQLMPDACTLANRLNPHKHVL